MRDDGLGKLIRDERNKRGWSQDRLAAEIGATQSTIERIENGRSLRSRFRYDAASALGLSTSVSATSQSGGHYRPPPELLGSRDFRIYSAAEGGPGEMVVDNEPIEVVPRPWYMRDVKDGYGVLVVGDSMARKYEPGTIVIVNPKLTPLRDRPALFISHNSEGTFRATVKIYINHNETDWSVEQLNPVKKFKLSRKIWGNAYRIVGSYEGA